MKRNRPFNQMNSAVEDGNAIGVSAITITRGIQMRREGSRILIEMVVCALGALSATLAHCSRARENQGAR